MLFVNFQVPGERAARPLSCLPPSLDDSNSHPPPLLLSGLIFRCACGQGRRPLVRSVSSRKEATTPPVEETDVFGSTILDIVPDLT